MPGRDGTGPMGEGAGTGRGAGSCVGYGRGFGGGRHRLRNRFRASGGFRGQPELAPLDPDRRKQALKNRVEALQAEMEAIKKQLADLDAGPAAGR